MEGYCDASVLESMWEDSTIVMLLSGCELIKHGGKCNRILRLGNNVVNGIREK